MQCAHCGKPLETRPCPSCQIETLKEALFCHRCGARLEAFVSSPNPSPGAQGEEDLSQRILCRDGTCIGVVNEQGFCKVCGKPYTQAP